MVNSVRAIKASIGRSPGRASNQPMHGNMREKHGGKEGPACTEANDADSLHAKKGNGSGRGRETS
jgi:hypothetical protein